jgi:hypothetical protein
MEDPDPAGEVLDDDGTVLGEGVERAGCGVREDCGVTGVDGYDGGIHPVEDRHEVRGIRLRP